MSDTLADITSRLHRAAEALRDKARDAERDGMDFEAARLRGKHEGVRLAWSYIEEYQRAARQTADTSCACGCGQDAATIERLREERDRLQRLVTEAALETYTPGGSERFVAEFHRVLAERDEWRRRRDLAVEQCRFLHQEGMSRRDHHLKHCGAARAAAQAEDGQDVLRATLARVEALTKALTTAAKIETRGGERHAAGLIEAIQADLRAALTPATGSRSAAEASQVPQGGPGATDAGEGL